MKSYIIDELCAGAWENAIVNTANAVNRLTGSNLTLKDWEKVERFAKTMRIRFDINGSISL